MFGKITKHQFTLIILAIFLFLCIYFIVPVAIPLIVALFTAMMLNPIVLFTERLCKIGRKSAVIIVFLLFLIIIGGAGTYLITTSITQIVHFVEVIPDHFNQLTIKYQSWEKDIQQYSKNLPPEFVKQVTGSFEQSLTKLSTTAKEIITLDNIAQIIAKIPQYLISFIVYLIALFLFMLEIPALKKQIFNLLTIETAKKVSFMNQRLSSVLFGFLKAQFLVSIVIFIVSLIGLLIITPHVAIVMALIIWIIDIIPLIGSIAVLGPWAILMFANGDNALGIQLTVLAIILLAIRRIVEPKVMGEHIGLSPLATLIAMFIGLKLFGVLGFIIGPLILIAFTSAKEAQIIKWNMKI